MSAKNQVAPVNGPPLPSIPTDVYDTETDQVDDEECETETNQVDDVDDESCFSTIIEYARVDPVIRAATFAKLRVLLLILVVIAGYNGLFTHLAPYLQRGNRLMEVECISLTGLKNHTLQLSIEGCDVALSDPATSLNPDGPLASWNNLPTPPPGYESDDPEHGLQDPRGTASTNPFLHGWPW
jgi:hypothetical protein